jgi:tight adherence protein B
MSAWIILAALLTSLAVWFTLSWVAAVRAERRKTSVQRRQEQIEADMARRQRRSLPQHVADFARRYGWTASGTPLVLGAVFLYFLIAAVLSVVGITGWLGVVIALPATVGAVAVVGSSVQSRRQRMFQSELLDAFDQFAASMRTSASPAKAIELQVPSLPEPLRSEMMQALDQHRANRPLADAMEEVADRYPSRAMNLFVAALRINEKRGGKLASALEQAAESLRRDTELASEAKAELAQDRMQFFGILVLLGLIAFVIFTQSGEATIETFTSPAGMAILAAGVANAAWGVFSVLRMMRRAGGES